MSEEVKAEKQKKKKKKAKSEGTSAPKTEPKREKKLKKEKRKGSPRQAMSCLDAAHKVLSKSKEPMNCKTLIAEMAAQDLWETPNGKTPEATLSRAIHAEIEKKGKKSRFKKIDRGQFVAV